MLIQIISGVEFFHLQSSASREGWVTIDLMIFDAPSLYRSYIKRPGQIVQDLLMPKQWHHLCVAINGISKLFTIVLVSKKGTDVCLIK